MNSHHMGVAAVSRRRWSTVLLMALVGCGQAPEAPVPQEPQAALQDVEKQAAHLSPPAGCTEITLGELKNGTELTPVLWGSQPTYRGELTTNLGDPAVADTARIRLDVNTGPGLYDLAAGGTNLFTCEQCFWGFQDAGKAGAQKMFVAESGALLLALKVSPQETLGALSNVVLREAVTATPTAAPYTGSALVPGGECRWLRFATWNTVRPGGCDPREGSLTANLPGLTCVPINYAADDGTLEKSLGTKTQGEACVHAGGERVRARVDGLRPGPRVHRRLHRDDAVPGHVRLHGGGPRLPEWHGVRRVRPVHRAGGDGAHRLRLRPRAHRRDVRRFRRVLRRRGRAGCLRGRDGLGHLHVLPLRTGPLGVRPG